MRIIGEQFRQRRHVSHKARRRLALCGTLRDDSHVTSRVRTANYSQEARWRLARAITDARKAAGHRHRPTFWRAAGIGKRSLEAAESLEPDAPSVGETVLHAIAQALPGWTQDTPRIILEGGPIPTTESVTAPRVVEADLAPRDEVLTATMSQLAALARMYAWYEAKQRGGSGADPEDEERFMSWALELRQRARRIEPSGKTNRDVS